LGLNSLPEKLLPQRFRPRNFQFITISPDFFYFFQFVGMREQNNLHHQSWLW